MVFGCIWTVNQHEPTYCSYHIQNNQWIISKTNTKTIFSQCATILPYSWIVQKFGWFLIGVVHLSSELLIHENQSWCCRLQQCRIVSFFIWIIQGTGAYVWRFFLCWIWWSWWKYNFHSFFWCAPAPCFNSFWGSPLILVVKFKNWW